MVSLGAAGPAGGSLAGTYPNPTLAAGSVGTAAIAAAAVTAAELAAGVAMSQQATTGTAGYNLVNGTGNIITWTTPNDGALHRVLIMVSIDVTSLETGGQINASVTYPDGSTFSTQMLAAALSAATHGATPAGLLVKANTTVAVVQQTALTGGAALLWAEIWGS